MSALGRCDVAPIGGDWSGVDNFGCLRFLTASHAATVRAEGGGKGRLTHELWGRPQLAKPLCESLSRFSIAFQAN